MSISTIIPADGWWLVSSLKDSGVTWRDAVACFALFDDGDVKAMIAEDDGNLGIAAGTTDQTDRYLWRHGSDWCTCGYTPNPDKPDPYWCPTCAALHPSCP